MARRGWNLKSMCQEITSSLIKSTIYSCFKSLQQMQCQGISSVIICLSKLFDPVWWLHLWSGYWGGQSEKETEVVDRPAVAAVAFDSGDKEREDEGLVSCCSKWSTTQLTLWPILVSARFSQGFYTSLFTVFGMGFFIWTISLHWRSRFFYWSSSVLLHYQCLSKSPSSF